MDIPAILEKLRPDDDWGPCADSSSTYEELKRAWRSEASACPTKAEMLAAWETIQAEATLKDHVEKSSLARAIEILKNDVPDNWRDDANPQRRIAWATKRLFVEVRQELREGGAG